jgi:hypothetical protein
MTDIDLTDLYTYTGSVHIDNCVVSGPFLRTLLSDGSEMRSQFYVRPYEEIVNGKYTIVRRFFSVKSKTDNGQPQQKYEVILTLLDQEGREAGPQFQTRFGSGHPSMALEVNEPAVTRLCGDSGRLCYHVEIRSLEKNLTKASATIDAEKKWRRSWCLLTLFNWRNRRRSLQNF